jgi:uncharacterized protein (DUF362 family)/Pyruvate/2-oxoacid:ferredoxin oxidoreductase delta subunit
MKSRVAVVKCEDYSEDKVHTAVTTGIGLIGGVSAFVKKGEQILLKPNLLAGDAPQKAVTTHPAVFKAVARLFMDEGARVLYGDSPGKGKPERIAQQAGIKEVADNLGIQLADFRTPVTVSYPAALLAKQLVLAAGVLEADGIVSIAKMKTHGFTRITGAVKNQFGCIPGLRKAEYHVKMPDIFEFSKVLVDINNYIKPRLYILDGIIAMEGNGPRSGEPVPMKVLLFSTDPVALDAVFCRLIHLNPLFVPTSKTGKKAGLGAYLPEEIDILGEENISQLINKNFKATRRKPERLASARYFPTFLKNLVSPKPVILYDRCVNCGSCVLQCPVNPKAVNWPHNNTAEKPVYNYKDCIRCYCCQEICPEKAIDIKVPPLGKLIYR